MGKIKQGILGGFSGKVGSVIGSSWNGKSYMRGKAVSIKNPNTAKQQMTRAKFTLAISTLRPVAPFIRIGFKGYANGKTAYNAAMSYTFKNAITGEFPEYSIDYAKLLVSRGSLAGANSFDVESTSGKIKISWDDNSDMGNARLSDIAMIAIINPGKGEASYITEGAPRSFGYEEVPVNQFWTGDEVEVYLSFISEDEKQISNSTYCGSVTVV